MKLSDNTLDILKNFATINMNLYIEKDTNVLRTVSDSKHIFAEAEVEETFPVGIGIMNLNSLLKTISMFNEPEFEFHETHMFIKEVSGNNKFKYHFTDPSCLTFPKGRVKPFPTPVSFTLNEDTLGQLRKAAITTSLPDVKINYDDNVVKLEIMERKNSTSNVFSLELEGEGAAPLTAFMKVDNLKVIPDDYKMLVSDRATLLQSLSPEHKTLQYCIAMDLTNVR